MSLWCPWKVGHKIHHDVLPLPLSHLQWLKLPCWLLVLSLNLLTRETSSNKVPYVSLHSAPVVLTTKILVHLRATWMHDKSRAVKLPENLLSQSFNRGTTTRPLYRRLPFTWTVQPSSPIPDYTRSLMNIISASCPWDSITLLNRDGVATKLPNVPCVCSLYCSPNCPTISSIRHSQEAILANTPRDFRLSASATTFALPGW